MLTERRSWGHFEQFVLNEPSTVKLIYVDSGKRLSLQYHHNRTEFWKIVKGPVRVQVGENKKILQTGEAIVVPMKIKHRIEGVGTDAIILEISKGEFDENDIVRIEDDYNRI